MANEYADMVLEDVARIAGWNEHSQIILACSFINQQGLVKGFKKFLADQANEEADPDEGEDDDA